MAAGSVKPILISSFSTCVNIILDHTLGHATIETKVDFSHLHTLTSLGQLPIEHYHYKLPRQEMTREVAHERTRPTPRKAWERQDDTGQE